MLAANAETNYLGLTLVIILFTFLLAWILKTAFWGRIAPVKTVKARVVARDNTKLPSRYPRSQPSCRVIFDIKGKTKAFTVSSFSYASYQPGQEGILKYKGDRIISFE